MTHTAKALAFASVALLAVACSGTQGGVPAQMPAAAAERSTSTAALPAYPGSNYVRACPTLRPREDVLCDALIRTDVKSNAKGNVTVAGLTPDDLHAAYDIPKTGGTGHTIGIVDALDDPYAESDLARYRAHFHLPPCTTANGCFRKLNQGGVAGNYPTADVGWSHEISLDLDMASAICPACRILLVEGATPTFKDLGAAVDMAVAKGAQTVSNSYSGEEFAAHDKDFDHKGVLIVAATGDTGFGAGPLQPASFSTVVAVGGTSLSQTSGGRGWTETAWSLGGAGCSRQVRKPAWQHDAGCSMRTEADVSAVADPNTGVAVYDSLGINGSPWQVFGGTSVSSPIVASLYALAGNAASQDAAKGIWQDAGAHLFDVTAGNDGYCSPAYLCNAGVGYDAVTGWGTPNGLAAFSVQTSPGFVDVDAVNALHGNQTIVSDGVDNTVGVYGPGGRRNALLTAGINQPAGIATDGAEKLYVANCGDDNVLIYPKPYTTVAVTLQETDECPQGVAVSNAGVIAVFNAPSLEGGIGNVTMYAKGAKSPCATTKNVNLQIPRFGAFDASGNLFVDGFTPSGSTFVGEISGGCAATAIATLVTTNTIVQSSSVQVRNGDVLILDLAAGSAAQVPNPAIYVYAPPSGGSLGLPKITMPLTKGLETMVFALAGGGHTIWAAHPGIGAGGIEYSYPAGRLLEAFDISNPTFQPTGIAVNPRYVP